MGFFLTAPSAPPANVRGHNTSSTSVWVDWDNVPLADQNGIILSYTVTYTALPNGSPKTAVVSAPTTQASLTGLTKTIALRSLPLMHREMEISAYLS